MRCVQDSITLTGAVAVGVEDDLVLRSHDEVFWWCVSQWVDKLRVVYRRCLRVEWKSSLVSSKFGFPGSLNHLARLLEREGSLDLGCPAIFVAAASAAPSVFPGLG